ncbi:MAG TPA: HAD family hydrolase [Actinomycetes bacterium]|nr:HAD family hydrolase [Actinomycetes bacterium]
MGQDRRTGRGRGGYRLVASDLDGTLLGPDGEVSARTRAVLRRLGEAGITVVVVTGRPPRWIRGLLDDDVVHELVICANGAVVYDPGAGRVVTTDPLPAAVAARLVARLRERAPGVTFAVETGEELRCELQHPLHGGGPGGTGDALDLVRGPVCKLIAHAPDGRVEALHALAVELAGEEAVATVSGFELVEISAAGVTKAFALERLCGELGVAAAEVIAFGDMPNDLPMLAWAGHGVAVGNAHPAVLARADEVAASNADDGVAEVLERLLPAAR